MARAFAWRREFRQKLVWAAALQMPPFRLLALAHLWKIEATTPELLEIAAEFGCRRAIFPVGWNGTGQLEPERPFRHCRKRATQHLIVVTPNASVSTAEAYAALNSAALTTSDADPILSSSRYRGKFSEIRHRGLRPSDLENDFESVIFDIEPEIRRAKEALLQAGAR